MPAQTVIDSNRIIVLLDLFHRLNIILEHLPADFDVEIKADIEYGMYNILTELQFYERMSTFPLR